MLWAKDWAVVEKSIAVRPMQNIDQPTKNKSNKKETMQSTTKQNGGGTKSNKSMKGSTKPRKRYTPKRTIFRVVITNFPTHRSIPHATIAELEDYIVDALENWGNHYNETDPCNTAHFTRVTAVEFVKGNNNAKKQREASRKKRALELQKHKVSGKASKDTSEDGSRSSKDIG